MLVKRAVGISEEEVGAIVVDAAIEVHRVLGGPGLLEAVYEEALAYELELRGLSVSRQSELPIRYKGRLLKTPLRLDLLAEQCVIVECKAVEKYNTISQVQTLTYLRLSRLRLAFVINFGEKRVSRGIHRVINSMQ
jgi:GxxExxY protein